MTPITHRMKSTLLTPACHPLLYLPHLPTSLTSLPALPHWLPWWDLNIPSSFGPQGLCTFHTYYLFCSFQLFPGLAPSRQSDVSFSRKPLCWLPRLGETPPPDSYHPRASPIPIPAQLLWAGTVWGQVCLLHCPVTHEGRAWTVLVTTGTSDLTHTSVSRLCPSLPELHLLPLCLLPEEV